jgi:glucose/arabinose dehydrogenase
MTMPKPMTIKLLLPTLAVWLTSCGGSDGGTNLMPPQQPPGPGPASVQTQQVFAMVNLSFATALVQAPNDASRWFAIEKSGRVVVFDNDTANATGALFLDISARVDSGPFEAGLLGIAFHPDFANNGEVFVSYTAPAPLTSVISRFRSFDNNQTLDPLSEEIILTVTQPFTNHNGGQITFGSDGFLYAAFGDGGDVGDPQGNGQDQTNLLGTIIRIDVDIPAGYTIPPTNPFPVNANLHCLQGFGGALCPEIYAWGFRNPWRFSFDSLTDALWVGDVGQDTWEEVDRVELGENYGWNVREGAHCFAPSSGCSTAFVDPITEYDHSLGNSITGGYVYRGSAIPDLVGQYVFGDFGSGRIWAVPAGSPIGTAPVELADTGHQIASFGEGVDGELYLIDYGNAATIHQIVP